MSVIKEFKLLILTGFSSILSLILYFKINDDYATFNYLKHLTNNNIYNISLSNNKPLQIINNYNFGINNYYILITILFIVWVLITDMFIDEFKKQKRRGVNK